MKQDHLDATLLRPHEVVEKDLSLMSDSKHSDLYDNVELDSATCSNSELPNQNSNQNLDSLGSLKSETSGADLNLPNSVTKSGSVAQESDSDLCSASTVDMPPNSDLHCTCRCAFSIHCGGAYSAYKR